MSIKKNTCGQPTPQGSRKVTIAGTARGFTENLFGTLADGRFNRGSIVMVVVAGAAAAS